MLPGAKYKPEIMPRQTGITIRRKGISLFSTPCSFRDRIKLGKSLEFGVWSD